MRVPVYEVKVNGSNASVLSVNINQSQQSPFITAEIVTADGMFQLGDNVVVSFFNIPILKGVITEIRETQNKFIYIVNTSKTARKLAKKDYITSINTNAFGFFIDTMRKNGISVVYKTSSAPTLKFQGEFVIKKGSDIIAEFMRYFRDFAPILYYDSVSNILHIFLDATADTCYNITPDAVLSYTITHKIRYASVMLTNGVVVSSPTQGGQTQGGQTQGGQTQGETCSFDVSYSSPNISVKNTYKITADGKIELSSRETITYGNIADYIRSGSTYLGYLSRPTFVYGIVSKTVQHENGATERWGWIQRGWSWIPTLPQSPTNNVVVGDVAVHVPTYGFGRIEGEKERKSIIKTECGKEVEIVTKERSGYIYGLKGGGVLSADEAMRFNATIPGDVELEGITGVSTKVAVKNSKAVYIQETAVDMIGGGVKTRDMEITVPQQAPISVVVLPNGNILQLPEPPSATQKGITTPGELSITIPDLTKESLPWVASVINNLYLKHAQTLNITTPLLIVQVGYKICFKGTNYVIESYTHSITQDRATTTILARAL